MTLLASAPPQIVIWFLYCVVALFYMSPTLVGLKRGVPNGIYLFLLNLALGWTVVGWAIALVWACKPLKRISLPQRIDRERARRPDDPDLDWLQDTTR
jgi:hypothetical protein